MRKLRSPFIRSTVRSFTVRFGKIGTKGQMQTKSFASPGDARAAADKLIAEKLRKGYREVT
ncbi:MAG: WGR domain-containing protein [Planctomycetes bacterium]|nr:WGR domain-containing protein [Planctomycetota bacterium]